MSKSILHVLNAKIQNLPKMIFSRETLNYKIYYEQKIYSIHKLLIKIQKNLDIQKDSVDINVNIYNRLTIKTNTNPVQLILRPDTEIDKTVSMRIAKTKYTNLPLKYVSFLQIFEKQTWAGAETKFIPKIQECELVVKEPQLCYKIVSIQKANTHWMKTILIVKQTPEPIQIGKLSILTSRMNYYEKDVYA
jgi:hypothetical protein